MKSRPSKSQQRTDARQDLKAIEEALKKPLRLQEPFDYTARAQQVKEAQRLNALASSLRFRPLADSQVWDVHKATAERFWKAVGAAYPPGFWEECLRLKSGDASGLESAIGFLEADPYFFRSGYVKAWLIRAIKPPMLTAAHKARLHTVVLHLVETHDDRDFRAYCRLARKVDAPKLREQLTRRLTHSDPNVRRRAKWVLEALEQKDSQG